MYEAAHNIIERSVAIVDLNVEENCKSPTTAGPSNQSITGFDASLQEQAMENTSDSYSEKAEPLASTSTMSTVASPNADEAFT
ncbi:hypothetical protein CSKR_200017 [Clonorchis sinensis]|uniref:Uncharacterized protein n=1 Tax=Clonorchis sinensis TaxID=79923 RepID=A0A8T1LY51_CLOSI|nr:hypothetical protein CSKR_200017 [Clonorchis sinensis]